MKGALTRSRYRVATVFVDHYSDLSYVYLQQTTSGEETVRAKQSFKQFSESHGIPIKHYHCDNGRFADNKFKNHILSQHQTISYCGVNAHFQNGRAEKRIRDLQDNARTMLLHAEGKWPNAISKNLWPYALKMTNTNRNDLPRPKDGISPHETFSSVSMRNNTSHKHVFGCPVYALNASLQAGRKIPKWDIKARLGIYLGNSQATIHMYYYSDEVGHVSQGRTEMVADLHRWTTIKYDDGSKNHRLGPRCHCSPSR